MKFRRFLLAALSAGAFFLASEGRADSINDGFVKAELYVWNRFADLCEALRVGIAGGAGIGAEVAITDKAQLGAYSTAEKGAAFEAIWVTPALDNEDVVVTHGGKYSTAVIGPESKRKQSSELKTVRFERDKYDVRAQAALGVAHAQVRFDGSEAGDFFAGIIGIDFKKDDARLDPSVVREPARQLGRGCTNILTGFLEIPKSMHEVNLERGDFAGLTEGLFKGVYRFLTRETVGVVEVVTFPMGWEPIIEPEFPLMPTTSSSTPKWVVRKPAFRE